jgi:purine-binding chemotaxis protein CheW
VNDAYILFEVAGTTYAVPSRDIMHMEMVDTVTPVPNAAPFVDGVVLSRGQVVPVVNLRARFGFERAALGLRTRLLVVQTGSRTLGLLVDTAREFVRLAASDVQPPHETIAGTTGPYVAGTVTIADRVVLVLDLARLVELTHTAVPA